MAVTGNSMVYIVPVCGSAYERTRVLGERVEVEAVDQPAKELDVVRSAYDIVSFLLTHPKASETMRISICQ